MENASLAVATAVVETAMEYEASWNTESLTHTVTLEEAAINTNPELGRLVYLALNCEWDDAIEWAVSVLNS